MKTKSNKPDTLTLIAIVILMMGVINGLMSCSKKGYGCRGNESWRHLERRINNGF